MRYAAPVGSHCNSPLIIQLKSGYIPNIEVEKPLGSASSTIVNTSTVQFMWQPLTEITYPKIALIASFEVGVPD